MTPKEAIFTIKTAIAEVEWEYPMNYAAAFERAIETLTKELDCADKPHLDWTLREVATHCTRHLQSHGDRCSSCEFCDKNSGCELMDGEVPGDYLELVVEHPVFEGGRRQTMNKPLKDWTLGEVIYYCGNMGPLNCKKCHFGRPNGKCTLFKDIPSAWDLTDPPRFTEQEVEDAKTMIRMFPALNLIWRDNSGILEIRNEECTDGAIINPAMFPSIKSGETVELSDIIGGNND